MNGFKINRTSLTYLESKYVVLSLQHRPMKKVRKSLALDVMDCRMTIAGKLKPNQPEPNRSTRVWGLLSLHY